MSNIMRSSTTSLLCSSAPGAADSSELQSYTYQWSAFSGPSMKASPPGKCVERYAISASKDWCGDSCLCG